MAAQYRENSAGGKPTMPIEAPGAPVRSLRMRIQRSPERTVVLCSGRLTAEVSAAFKEQVKGLLPEAPRLVLDLTDLQHMDSSGLGALVALYVSARSAQRELELVNLNQRIRELLRISNLLSLFGSGDFFLTKMP